MSRTRRTFKGKTYPEKSRRKPADRKDFGFTSGIHSQLEKAKADLKKQVDENPNDKLAQLNYDRVKDKTHTVKGVDFVKYGREKGRGRRSNSQYKLKKNQPNDDPS